MSFGSRVKEQRERCGLSRKDLADLIGVTASAIANYENSISSPKAELLYPLIDALQCDPNYLFRDEMDARGGSPTKLLYEEMEYIKKYRSLDDYGKEAVDSILNLEYRRVERARENAKTEAAARLSGDIMDHIIPFRRSCQPASAGTGMYLGPDEFETIYVQENDLTCRASFGVPVSGDSMEPSYHDGDVLLVERAEDIKVGEVGVFTINGEGYVKERGQGELISLNPAYDPIPMNESIFCSGRVIGVLEPDWIVEG